MRPAVHLPPGRVVFVPLPLADQFPGHRLVARSDNPGSFPGHLQGDNLERIEYLQLTDFEADPSPLLKWESVFPLDLVMKVPRLQFPRLYTFAPLLDRGPVRVSIPVDDGLEKAVKLAASLHFSVKIIPGQPESNQVVQLLRLADFYLKNPIIEEPIEFFHSLFFAIVNSESTNLWEILEKDPSRYCVISDEGRITDGGPGPVPHGILPTETNAETASSPLASHDLQELAMTRHKTCAECRYFRWCRGFFKYPDPDYSCGTVLSLFDHLAAAAAEFKQDLSAWTPEMPT